MPFEIVRNDITNMRVDAIVNSANPRPVVGLGTDSSIHEKAGPELFAARQKIGPIAMGQAAITPAFRLHAKYVIHTVGPVWDGGSYGEEILLRSCYDQSLKLALEHDCKSIAFPLIATNNYGFPKDKALQIAVAAFSEFLLEHEMQIYPVVFDRGAYRLSEKLFHSMAVSILMRVMADGSAVGSGTGIRGRTTAGAMAPLCGFLLSDGCTTIWKLCAGWRDSPQM